MSEKIKTKLSELKRHYDFEIINQKLSNKTIIVSPTREPFNLEDETCILTN